MATQENENAAPRLALVTGGAQRIGAASVRALHQAGYQLAIHYSSSADAAKALCEELNHIRANSAFTLQANLCSSEAPKTIRVALEDWASTQGQDTPRLSLLLNNASGFYPTPLADASEADWDALMGSNLKGPYFLSQALLPMLRAEHEASGHSASIINMLDIHADKPLQEHSIYCAAKAGLAMLTKAFAQELGPDIRVNGIAPGAILWPSGEHSDSVLNEADAQADILSRTPLGRIGCPEDIAKLVVFLAQAGDYISGQIIAVDGGRSTSI